MPDFSSSRLGTGGAWYDMYASLIPLLKKWRHANCKEKQRKIREYLTLLATKPKSFLPPRPHFCGAALFIWSDGIWRGEAAELHVSLRVRPGGIEQQRGIILIGHVLAAV